ncbi:MAG: hypothetical protein JNN20_20170, partial [Betaproteobacteria bacterium]|nr:hypothetical protein [Betaproteobacteria bacterium]
MHFKFATLAGGLLLFLAGCTGGGGDAAGMSGMSSATEQPVKLAPDELQLFPGGQGEFQIISGRRPFRVTLDNAAALTVQNADDDFKVRVFAR